MYAERNKKKNGGASPSGLFVIGGRYSHCRSVCTVHGAQQRERERESRLRTSVYVHVVSQKLALAASHVHTTPAVGWSVCMARRKHGAQALPPDLCKKEKVHGAAVWRFACSFDFFRSPVPRPLVCAERGGARPVETGRRRSCAERNTVKLYPCERTLAVYLGPVRKNKKEMKYCSRTMGSTLQPLCSTPLT